MPRFFAFALCLLLTAVPVLAQSAGEYVIGPQDVLTIAVYDQPELGGKYAVELDGSFTFPLIGRIQAGGLTIRDFEQALNAKLADGYFRNPQATVAIEQYRSQRVFVTGEVRTPGAYPLTGDMTLIEALAKAGSTTQFASDEVMVVRSGKDAAAAAPGAAPGAEPSAGAPPDSASPDSAPPDSSGRDTIRVNLKELQTGAAGVLNLDLRDGDTIYVARAELVYVFGQVKAPGSYPIRTDTTVLQALSLAGGVLPTGAMNRARVIRIVNGDKQEIRVDLTDIIQPEDTLVVPERFF